MKRLTLGDIGLSGDTVIQGLSCDSRQIEPGYVFAALPGTFLDGRDFIPQAINNGAIAVLSTSGAQTQTLPLLASRDPRLDYARLSKRLYPDQPETIVAVTGTNGKSSTVEFLRQIWQSAGRASACFGTLGVRLADDLEPMSHTTPDALALHRTLSDLEARGITHAAMEASSHGLDQRRMDAVTLSAAGFTNLTQDHYDYHGTPEAYFDAKARLFTELLPDGRPVVVMVDDEAGRTIQDMCDAKGFDVRSVGWAGRDVRIAEIMPRAASQLLTLVIDGDRAEVELPLAAEFQALNAVTALGLAMATGVTKDDALSALSTLSGVAGRLEIAGTTGNGAPVFVDFAHTEDGLSKLLRSVRPHVEGRLHVVFGCGGDRDTDKRPKMGAAACRHADDVIVTDDNPRSEDPAAIRAAVLSGCPDATEIGDRRAAIAEGIARLKPGDCLVVAGKGHEQGQIVGDTIIPFNDVTVVQELLS
ncbi:UDP-N-acetylmuramoyl-L-alanyl-D-glutamate--2,6-diaminopimelate ligase [uncultured Algimonas sp.]|uniref:UDP-N-acetylmuramoyl-L-alanyl-D-glutamate--2, 6-diaminopimelate ligase n=1 Tax=uncultured Algimonas sp. TaxID=1547920 RepID=UPI0026309FD8|nr:UDP-N-acetylmuramoyl-L-alanyl-D-glutamate--2,6-diaminopimelate ligase [uncultured Algimonas sp.]